MPSTTTADTTGASQIFDILKSNKVETPSREKLDNKVDDSTMKSLNILT